MVTLEQISWVLKSYDNIQNILFPEDESDEPGDGGPGELPTFLSNTNQRRSKTVENRRT